MSKAVKAALPETSLSRTWKHAPLQGKLDVQGECLLPNLPYHSLQVIVSTILQWNLKQQYQNVHHRACRQQLQQVSTQDSHWRLCDEASAEEMLTTLMHSQVKSQKLSLGSFTTICECTLTSCITGVCIASVTMLLFSFNMRSKLSKVFCSFIAYGVIFEQYMVIQWLFHCLNHFVSDAVNAAVQNWLFPHEILSSDIPSTQFDPKQQPILNFPCGDHCN